MTMYNRIPDVNRAAIPGVNHAAGPRGRAFVAFLVALALVLAAAWVSGCAVTGGGKTSVSGGSTGGGSAPGEAPLGGSSRGHEGPGEIKGPVLKVFFIDVGQGDGILIQTPRGKNILIDTGRDDRAVPEFLRGQGVKGIDVLVTTHPHADHISGALAVLQAWPVGQIYDSGKPYASPIYERYLERVKQLVKGGKTTYHRGRAGDRIEVSPEVILDVIQPGEPLPEDPNNASLVLRLSFGKVSFLFMGDAGREAEGDILKRKAGLRADVLKVGHHGSRYGTSKEFLEAVNPRIAVIQSGRGNDYGHPHRETLERLKRQDVRLYRNDLDGTVLVTTDGQKYEVTTSGKRSTTPQ